MSKAGSTEKQQAGRLLFKEAVAYARIAVKNAEERKRLKKKRGKGSPYNKAIKEYMKAHSTRNWLGRKKSVPGQPPNKAVIPGTHENSTAEGNCVK